MSESRLNSSQCWLNWLNWCEGNLPGLIWSGLVGGPAQRSGLRQGDSVLQLNGLPVETWTCADLAQAIR